MGKPGHALGEAAYYYGSSTAQTMWKEMCQNNCNWKIDLVGVPYIVHRDDLERIAPLWKMYSLIIKEKMEDRAAGHAAFKSKYGRLDPNWAAEMFGYNMAAAHAGVKHEEVHGIQVRDVANERRKDHLQGIAMLHIGRAWMPHSYAPAQQWAHTEGKSFSRFGQQVWCKCNHSASAVMPWPVPEDADFQSTKTLEALHYSNERFGKVPVNLEFRKGPGPGTYSHTLD